MHVLIYSSSKKIYESDEVVYIEIPTQSGVIGVLDEHSPLISNLDIGELKVKTKTGEIIEIALLGGFVKIKDSQVFILANEAEMAEDIIKAEIDKAIRRTEEKLKEDLPSTDLIQLEKQIKYLKLRRELAKK